MNATDFTSYPRERRQSFRKIALKKATLLVTSNRSSFDCRVLDESDHGLRVSTALPISIPEQLVVAFPDGTTIEAKRCWIRGNEMGLKFLGPAMLPIRSIVRAARIYDAFKTIGCVGALRMLRDERFFNDPLLRETAHDLEAAMARFEEALCCHVEKSVATTANSSAIDAKGNV